MLEDASRKLDTLSRFRSGTWTVDRQFEIVVHPRIEIRGDRFAISTGIERWRRRNYNFEIGRRDWKRPRIPPYSEF